MPSSSSSSSSSMTPEEKNAAMASERAFLSALLQAALAGDFSRLQTALSPYAASQGLTALQVLTDCKDGHGRTALHFACQSKPDDTTGPDIVERLLSEDFLGAAASLEGLVSCADQDGLTPIMLAASHSDHALAQARVQLLQAACPKAATQTTHTGATALHYAAGAGNAQLVQRLLKQHAQGVSIEAKGSGTPLHWACVAPPPADYSETLHVLLEAASSTTTEAEEPSSTTNMPPPLVLALAAGNATHACKLLEYYRETAPLQLPSTLQYLLPGDISVLHVAADLNLVRPLQMLLECMTGNKLLLLEKSNHEGLTPLQVAAREGHTGCVLLLLAAAAAAQNANDETPTEQDAADYIAQHQEGLIAKTKDAAAAAQSSPGTAATHDSAVSQVKQWEQQARVRAAALADVTVTETQQKTGAARKAQGNAAFAASQWQEAVDCYTAAIAADPTVAAYYSNRSACFMQLKDYPQALQDALICRLLKPDWPKGAYRLAVARLALEEYEEAAMAAWEGLQLDASNDELKSLLQKCVKKGRKNHQAKQGK